MVHLIVQLQTYNRLHNYLVGAHHISKIKKITAKKKYKSKKCSEKLLIENTHKPMNFPSLSLSKTAQVRARYGKIGMCLLMDSSQKSSKNLPWSLKQAFQWKFYQQTKFICMFKTTQWIHLKRTGILGFKKIALL